MDCGVDMDWTMDLEWLKWMIQHDNLLIFVLNAENLLTYFWKYTTFEK